MTKYIRPDDEQYYCERCGKQFKEVTHSISYHPKTGEKEINIKRICPSWWCRFKDIMTI